MRFQLYLFQGIQSVLNKGRPDMDQASACFSKALASIHLTSATPEALKGGKGAVPPGSLFDDTDESSSSASAPGFDDNVNRNLVIPCPPRAVKVKLHIYT